MFFLGVRGFLFGNFRILVIASEVISRNSKFILGILEFPVILGLDPRISIGNSKFILGILNFCSLLG